MLRRLITVLLAAAAATLGVTPPASATPPPRCGDTVSGAVRLTGDLRCTDVALVLAPGTTLDLGGHKVTGPGKQAGSAFRLQESESTAAVTVRNGTVRGWAKGMDFGTAAPTPDLVLDRLSISAVDQVAVSFYGRVTVRHSSITGASEGIRTLWGAGTVVDSAFTGNGRALSIAGGGQLTVSTTTFQRNDTALACDEAGIALDRSLFHNNTTAMLLAWCEGSQVSHAVFSDNTTAYSESLISPTSSTSHIRQSVFLRNTTAVTSNTELEVAQSTFSSNGDAIVGRTERELYPVATFLVQGNTITHNARGIVIDGPAQIGHNVVIANEIGIRAPHATDLGGNIARRNTAQPQCVGVTCDPR